MNDTSLSSVLQHAIDTGRIADMHQLLDVVRQHGLEITRNGRDYLGLLPPGGRRFRVHFAFDNHTRVSRTIPDATSELHTDDGGVPMAAKRDRITAERHWIYALTAWSPGGAKRACYVGQTRNIPRRIRQHIKYRDESGERVSGPFFVWASKASAQTRVTVLTELAGDCALAAQLEGYWLKLAQNAGYETPGSEHWGQLPRPLIMAGQPVRWPWERVVLQARILEEVAALKAAPEALFQYGVQVIAT